MSLRLIHHNEPVSRLHEIRPHQVFRLERPRRRPLLQRLRRSVVARLNARSY
jgi:hypothetical protein